MEANGIVNILARMHCPGEKMHCFIQPKLENGYFCRDGASRGGGKVVKIGFALDTMSILAHASWHPSKKNDHPG